MTTTEQETMTIEEYRAQVEAEIAFRLARHQGLRGLHNFLSGVVVPGATHAQLVRTNECFSPGCPDHGWM